ncbi:MAG: sugar phosphate isomerase/epimerase family protein [Desulfomonilaceae bacterium]|jgi:sugar phosphate isomerase/epimerase
MKKVEWTMLFGAPIKSPDDITRLRRMGFDFGEIAMASAQARRMWLESGVVNGSAGKFFLTAHGPLEHAPNDAKNLWNRYIPRLVATIDILNRMCVNSLNIHLVVDKRVVSSIVLGEKIRALRQLVEYGKRNSVAINLENLTETADDLDLVLNAAPDLGITLDVGHANLHGLENISISIIDRLGQLIRHVHLHDNRGGTGQHDDLHLPIGHGRVEFKPIITSLCDMGYRGTMTFEVKPEYQEAGRIRIQNLVT